MEETIKLATQVVILLTALVGLYKLSKAGTGGATNSKADNKAAAKHRPFEFMLDMIGVYGGILVPILFMLGLMWLINAINSSSSSKSPAPLSGAAAVQTSQLRPNERNLFYQSEVAAHISSSAARDVALSKIVRTGIREKAYAISLAAASHIFASQKRDEALTEIAESAANVGDGEIAAKAIAAIRSSFTRDEVAKKVLAGLEGGLTAESSSRQPQEVK